MNDEIWKSKLIKDYRKWWHCDMILGHLKDLDQRMTSKDIEKRGFSWVMEDDRQHGKAIWKIVGGC